MITMWRKLCPRFRNWRNIKRIDKRSARVAAKLATSQIATQTREKASPDLVAKIVPPINAASNPHASSPAAQDELICAAIYPDAIALAATTLTSVSTRASPGQPRH